MSIKLILVLAVLMVVNQILGTSYGSWKEGFNSKKLGYGLWKIANLAVAYGAIAFAAKFAAQYVPAAEYLSGILIEPIATYFTKICKSLRSLLSDSVDENIRQREEKKNQ